MAEYGPLTPSNRLEWFLMNGGSDGSGGGEGGESDFSLASVTITNTATDDCIFVAAVAADEGYITATKGENGISPGTETLQVVLYKGKALVFIDMTVSASSGAFEDLGDGDCVISGDCTITVSASPIG